jgi:hypothetical protein
MTKSTKTLVFKIEGSAQQVGCHCLLYRSMRWNR